MENVRVLVVEDDSATSLLVKAVLEHFGYVCDSCDDGNEAVRLLRRSTYDAILLDLMLPGQFGFDVLRHVQAERPSLANRIVIMTAASQDTLQDFDTSQVHAILHKPLDITSLVAEVGACTGRTGPPGT